MACSGGFGGSRCSGRLTAQLLILRLMTRGLLRWRRVGSSSKSSSLVAWSWAALSAVGGKAGVGPGRSACDAQGAGEGEAFGIVPGL